MATIAGTLKFASDVVARNAYIQCRLDGSPFDGALGVRHCRPVKVATNASTGAYSFTLAEGVYRVNIPQTPEFLIDVPRGDATYSLATLAEIYNEGTAEHTLSPELLLLWAKGELYDGVTPTYASDDPSRIISSTVVWTEDGSAGVFTVTHWNATFYAIDGYTVTHTDSGSTVVQDPVTRDEQGNITVIDDPYLQL